jgi:hypothetical protein
MPHNGEARRSGTAGLWGAETPVRVLTGGFPSWLCGSLVLADQAAEDFPTLQVDAVEIDRSRRSRGWLRRSQASRSMGTVEVIVPLVLGQHATQVTPSIDQEPISALAAVRLPKMSSGQVRA